MGLLANIWSRVTGSKPRAKLEQQLRLTQERYVSLKQKYDAAQTIADNRRHWLSADGLSAAAANSPDVRQTLRNRSRYTYDNDGYFSGIIRTRADDLVGTGPTLQILGDDDEINEQIEQAFTNWAAACGLAEKLHTMDQAECRDGEAFAVLTTNEMLDHPVKLDLRLIEADLVCDPEANAFPERLTTGGTLFDGIEYDAAGNPVRYAVLREHPGDNFGWQGMPVPFDWIPAQFVLHSFRVDRPGQVRGIPELTASLPLAAYMRRWTLATVSAAETAANFSAVLETEAPAADDDEDVPEPFVPLDIERSMMTTLPAGAKLHQFMPHQPRDNYPDTKREFLNEIGRPVQMPSNVVSGDSSKHNFSSAKLDHFGYRGGIRVRRSFRNRTLLERIFREFVEEAKLIPGLLPRGVDVLALPRAWYWPGWASMDKNEAKDDSERLNNSTTTLAELLSEWGMDWKTVLRQRGRELAYGKEVGVEPPPRRYANVDPSPDGDDTEILPDNKKPRHEDDFKKNGHTKNGTSRGVPSA